MKQKKRSLWAVFAAAVLVATISAGFATSAIAQDITQLPVEEGTLHANATQEDYQSLFALKTPGYERMPLSEFNAALLEWAEEDEERQQRIFNDMAQQDYQVSLSEDELSFVERTLYLSTGENFCKSLKMQSGTSQEPGYGAVYLSKEDADSGLKCELEYQTSYYIFDSDSLTVGERDGYIARFLESVQEFWDGKSLEELMDMTECEVLSRLHRIAFDCSNDSMRIKVRSDRSWFRQWMDGHTLDGQFVDPLSTT